MAEDKKNLPEGITIEPDGTYKLTFTYNGISFNICHAELNVLLDQYMKMNGIQAAEPAAEARQAAQPKKEPKTEKGLPPGIRQRPNGLYEGRVKHDNQSYSVYGKTIKDVKKKQNDLRYKLEHGDFIDRTKVTLDDWFHTWMEQYKVNQVKRGTSDTYYKDYQYYVKDALGSRKLSQIRGEHIQKLYNDLQKQNLAASSIKLVCAILNGCFKQALKNGLIEKNPVPLATLPREKERADRRVLTLEEQNLFMEYAKGNYLYNLFDLALQTGLRSGEIRGLKISDIDKAAGVLHVRRTLKYDGAKGFYEDDPKTKTSKRDIPLTAGILEVLERQRAFYDTGKVIKMDEYVFHLGKGEPISQERAWIEISRVVKSITDKGYDFETFTLHCFRHTFATRAIENGMNPQTLKAILGHSKMGMTMDLYAHVLPTTKAEEMEMISKAFQK